MILAETCPDVTVGPKHACPGRCRCYPNHWCNLDCTCTHCGRSTHDGLRVHDYVEVL